MRFFWPIYLVSALVGTAGVYFVAPFARPYVPELFRLPKPAQQNARPASVPVTAPARVPDEAGESVRQPDATRPAEAAAQADNKSSEEMPPALNGIYLAQRGEKPGWGVTHQRTVFYTLEGVRAGSVEGGVMLDFRGTHSSSKGGMVECVLYEHGSPSAPLLVGVKDVFLFTGSFTKLSARQREAVQAYYALSGKIANRKTELLQASAVKNPFFDAYQNAHKALMAHIDRAQALVKQREQTTAEQDKVRLADELREMKVMETRIRAEYDAIHLKFRTWKQEHANEIAQPERDPSITLWTKQKTDLIAQMPGLAY